MMTQNSPMKSVWFWLDVPFRLAALVMGLIALAAVNRFALKAGLSINLLILFEAVLMFLCFASPLRPSHKWFRALLIAAVPAGIYFFFRHLPSMIRQDFPVDIVIMNFIEIGVAIWFVLRTGGILGPSGQPA
jgi:hypothetical protein